MIGYFRSKHQLALEILNLKAELVEAKYQLKQQQKINWLIRKELTTERLMRKSVIDFLNKTCKKSTNEDGTTTIVLTSFVTDLSNLFISRKDMGIKDEQYD